MVWLLILLFVLLLPIYSQIPTSPKIYIGYTGSNLPVMYACVNVQNPYYASNTTIFSRENVCYYINTQTNTTQFAYLTSTFGNKVISLQTTPMQFLVAVEYQAGVNILKFFSWSPTAPYVSPGYPINLISYGYREEKFIETNPTGYFKLLFNTPGTYIIRYVAVDKAYGPQPLVYFGPVYSKEQIYNEPPRIYISSPTPGTMINETDTIQLVFTPIDPEGKPMVCDYYVGATSYSISVNSGEQVSVYVYLPYQGNITLRVICKDPLGAAGSAMTYVIRAVPPSSVITFPYDNLLQTSPSLPVRFMASSSAPSMVCNLSIRNTNITKSFNLTIGQTWATVNTTLDLTPLSAGYYYLDLLCVDSYGLQTSSSVRFEYATDPDQSQRYCLNIGGEYYGDHCCGDDPGEYTSKQRTKGYAFDPATCSLIQLQPGQCYEDSDCGSSGWFCTNQTAREFRVYTCDKTTGVVGTCKYIVQSTEDCTKYGSTYFCSYGVCTNQTYINQPPNITYIEIYDVGKTFDFRIDPNVNKTVYINVTNNPTRAIFIFVSTSDDNSAPSCNITLNNKQLPISYYQIYATGNAADYEFKSVVSDYVNGTNTLNIVCTDAYNLTTTATISLIVNKLQVECIVDSDCGRSGWYCTSPTELHYISFVCAAGKCTSVLDYEAVYNYTTDSIEYKNYMPPQTAPQGYICYGSSFISTSNLRCSTDADCPGTMFACTPDNTGLQKLQWYCDVATGTCKYNVTAAYNCPAGTMCVSGACWPTNETSLEGSMVSICTSNTTYMSLVATFNKQINKIVFVPTQEYTCPSGTMCFAGRCTSNVTSLTPPAIVIENITLPIVRVGETTVLVIRVYDPGQVVYLNVVARIPETIDVYKGVVLTSRPIYIFYKPPHASVHTIEITAINQYGLSSTTTTTVEVQEVTTTTPTGAATGAAPTGGAAVGGAAGAAPALPTGYAIAAPGTNIILAIIILAIIAILLFIWFRRR